MQRMLICQSLPLTAVKLRRLTVKREQKKSDKESNRMIFVVI